MSRFEKWSLLVTSGLTGATGIGYYWCRYLVESPEPWAVINHPLEPWLLKAHILVSPFLVLAVGAVASRHIWSHFKGGIGQGRRSGLLGGLTLIPMVVTGYLVQVVTHQGWLVALGWAHLALGLLYLVALTIHQVVAWAASRPLS